MADSAGRYKKLYQNEQSISTAYRRADQISQAQYVRADIAYRQQVDATTAANDRAQAAEDALEPAKKRLEELEGRTWAGKMVRKAGNVLKYVGGATLIYVTIRSTL